MNERIEDLILLAAIGEISDDEQRELEAATASDPEVAAELAAELETSALLLSSAAESAPPSLRASVLSEIESTLQDPGADAIVEGAAPMAPPVALANDGVSDVEQSPTTGSTAGDEVVSLSEHRAKRNRLVPILSAAAAAVVLMVGAIVVFTGGDDIDPIAAVAEADDAVERPLSGQLDGTLAVVHSPSEDAIVLDGSGLPAIAGDKTYVLWVITPDAATPVGEFRPDDDGRVELRLDGVDPGEGDLGVTEELATGGNSAHRTDPRQGLTRQTVGDDRHRSDTSRPVRHRSSRPASTSVRTWTSSPSRPASWFNSSDRPTTRASRSSNETVCASS